MTAVPTELSSTTPTASAPHPNLVVLLQAVRAYPCISIIARTEPAERMGRDDAVRLRRLAVDAVERLRGEQLLGTRSLETRMTEAVEVAVAASTQRAVCLFVSEAVNEVVRLPVPVTERVVIDPTFATRDLVRALHRTPRHVVLVLSQQEARLFDGVGDRLLPAQGSRFPLEAGPDRTDRRHRKRGEIHGESFLRFVDRALGSYLRVRPAPLVIVGAEPTASRFRALSHNVRRLAGVVSGSHVRTPLDALQPRIREVLEEYLLSRQREALDLLDRRRSEDKVVAGIDAAWLAARAERVEMLAVEEGFAYPARVSADGDFLQAAEDVEHPEVLDDAVDEVIEMVLLRGGWVAFVDDDALADEGRIALTLR